MNYGDTVKDAQRILGEQKDIPHISLDPWAVRIEGVVTYEHLSKIKEQMERLRNHPDCPRIVNR